MKLLLKQPKMLTSIYEIYKENNVIARLNCKGIIHLQAIAEIENQKFNIERKGWFRTKLLVRDTKTDQIIATYYSNFFGNGGVLTYTKNEQYVFKSKSWWTSQYVWLNKNDKELISLKTGGILKMNGEIDILDEALDAKKRMLLVLLGIYQIKLITDDSSAATAAV